LSILGREVDGELEVFILKCSKSDFFRKETAKGVYYSYLENMPIKDYHPQIVKVAIEEGNTTKYTFKSFCDLYYKKSVLEVDFNATPLQFDYLECGEEVIILKNTLKWM